jgi:hypothetical protein
MILSCLLRIKHKHVFRFLQRKQEVQALHSILVAMTLLGHVPNARSKGMAARQLILSNLSE